jgi:hypothetical protein
MVFTKEVKLLKGSKEAIARAFVAALRVEKEARIGGAFGIGGIGGVMEGRSRSLI